MLRSEASSQSGFSLKYVDISTDVSIVFFIVGVIRSTRSSKEYKTNVLYGLRFKD